MPISRQLFQKQLEKTVDNQTPQRQKSRLQKIKKVKSPTPSLNINFLSSSNKADKNYKNLKPETRTADDMSVNLRPTAGKNKNFSKLHRKSSLKFPDLKSATLGKNVYLSPTVALPHLRNGISSIKVCSPIRRNLDYDGSYRKVDLDISFPGMNYWWW